MGSNVSYLRLAELLVERLRPVLPDGMSVAIAAPDEVTEFNTRNARWSRFPKYRHEMGSLS